MIKKIILVLVILFISIQFIRPEKNDNGYESITAFEQETKPNPGVKKILRAQCYDCHSNQTKYPWYAEIAPVSWWLDHHIEEGKEHLNLANWSEYSVKKKDHKLEEWIEEVEEGEMPLPSYSLIHGDLSEEERELLINWAEGLREQYVDAD